jgi:hypothetical protein
MALAHTKTRAPRPRDGLLLPRPALLGTVRQALEEQRVLLICAPAGYGKTALLTQALAAQPGVAAAGSGGCWTACSLPSSPMTHRGARRPRACATRRCAVAPRSSRWPTRC